MIMRLVKYLVGLMMMAGITACNSTFEESVHYEDLDNIYNTLWHRNVVTDKAYFYDITFNDTVAPNYKEWYEGTMVCYDSEKRENRIEELCQSFIYNFTPGQNGNRAVVKTKFDNGTYYDGFLIPKGHIKINEVDVFIIQLYSVDANGNPLYNDKGEYQSSIMMWKE